MTKSSSSPPKRKNNYTIPQLKIEWLCSGEYSPFHYYPTCQAVEHRPTLTRLLRQRHLEIGIIDWMDDLQREHPDGEFIFVVEGVLMYFYEKQVKAFLHNVASRFGGGELWFDVCGTMMSRHGVKPDSLRHHEAQIRSELSDGHIVEQWEPALQLIEQANYMRFFRPRWGFFFGQILGRMTRLCYKFSSLLGYKIISK